MSPEAASRRAAIERERQRREDIGRQVKEGERPALPDLTDDEMGEEAVRLVKQSRRKRRREEASDGE